MEKSYKFQKYIRIFLANTQKYSKNFSDSSFWNKIGSITKRVGSTVIYQALLLFYTLKSPDVSIEKKAIICGALGYLILPLDIIPDILIPVGYTDDAAVILYVVGLVQNQITPEIENKAKEKLSDLGLADGDAYLRKLPD